MTVGVKPLDNIRTGVYDIYGTLTPFKVRLGRNLNKVHSDGIYYCKHEGNIIHCGITKLKNGEWVITSEEMIKGKARRYSKRKAFVVSAEEALNYILLSGNMELLDREKFKPLRWLYYYEPKRSNTDIEKTSNIREG